MIKGVDLSHYEHVESFQRIRDGGFDFAYLKCTEGISIVDPDFHAFAAGCSYVGLKFGAYHFYRGSDDPIEQAKLFLSNLGEVTANLPPVVDFETKADPDQVLKFLLYVEQTVKRTPVVYGGPSFLGDLKLSNVWGSFPLWVAHYGVKHPRVPKPWVNWTYWQFADDEYVPGVRGACDVNYFNVPMNPNLFREDRKW